MGRMEHHERTSVVNIQKYMLAQKLMLVKLIMDKQI